MSQGLCSITRWLTFIVMMAGQCTFAQPPHSLSIDSCYEWARQNYPLVKQLSLIEQSKSLTLANVSRSNFPQLHLGGQASYQSDVTEIHISGESFPFPFTFPEISKNQYRIFAEINQPVSELYNIRLQKELAIANIEMEKQMIEAELFSLKERVNQLYFGVLLIEGQLNQNDLLIRDMQAGLEKTNAAIKNGAALQSSADMLQAELLRAEQRTMELTASRKSYCDMLSLFINRPIDEQTHFEIPKEKSLPSEINRPELGILEKQKNIFDIQNNMVTAKAIPRLGFFVQGGYGRPALNMLNNNPDFYFLGGLRLNWNISLFHTYKREKQLLDIQKSAKNIEIDTFLFHLNLLLAQQSNEINKIRQLIATDNDIVMLRENIKMVAQSQLENGNITAMDYIAFVNAEDRARQDRRLHQILLLMAYYNYHHTSGN